MACRRAAPRCGFFQEDADGGLRSWRSWMVRNSCGMWMCSKRATQAGFPARPDQEVACNDSVTRIVVQVWNLRTRWLVWCHALPFFLPGGSAGGGSPTPARGSTPHWLKLAPEAPRGATPGFKMFKAGSVPTCGSSGGLDAGNGESHLFQVDSGISFPRGCKAPSTGEEEKIHTVVEN